jgi:EamA domain-containing membrane protein RarD
MLGFSPGDALPGPLPLLLSVPACSWGVLPSASEMHTQLDSGQVIVHRMLFQNCAGFYLFFIFLANSNLFFLFEAYQWFTSCAKPSVFTLVKSSLDCRL